VELKVFFILSGDGELARKLRGVKIWLERFPGAVSVLREDICRLHWTDYTIILSSKTNPNAKMFGYDK